MDLRTRLIHSGLERKRQAISLRNSGIDIFITVNTNYRAKNFFG